MTGKRRQWAPPIAKRRAKSAQTRKSDGHNRSRRLSEPVFAGLQLPVFYRDYPFEAWLAFLKLQELIVEANDSFSISDLGEDFLRYILYQRYPEEKFG